MNSNNGHKIKHRKKAKDVFITPKDLALKHIEYITESYNTDGFKWLDPCRNNENGSYYSQFPNNKDWCEILEDKDFFEYQGEINVICGNPPYSIIDKFLEKSVDLKPDIISYLIGINNLTARRIEYMKSKGYYLAKIKMLKIFQWFGMSFICIWRKGYGENLIDIDRKVYK